MSTIIILTPVVIATWPAITAAVTAAAIGMGLNIKEKVMEKCEAAVEAKAEQAVEVELENSDVLASSVASGNEMVLTKDGITLRVTRDARGRCRICAEGKGYSKVELKQLAQEFSEKVSQCFVYHKTVSELKNKNFHIVNEDVTEDGSIHIHVRRWVE